MRIKYCTWTLVLLALSLPARAEVDERLNELEKRIEQVEQSAAGNSGFSLNIPGWMRRFHLSGNSDFSYLYGEKNSFVDEGRFAVENARLFLEVDLGGEVRFFDRTLMESSSFYFEWDIVREASLKNKVGSMYLRLDTLGGQEAFNLKFGRMPIPFGEEYLRFHEQRPENPLISYSAPAPYNWDEGVMLFGSFAENKVQYLFAVMDGDDGFNTNTNAEPQIAGKLILEPWPWLHFSVSGIRTGKLGDSDTAAKSALEWGGTHAVAIPIESGELLTFRNGAPITMPDTAPLHTLNAYEVDLILNKPGVGRLWFAGGQAFIESGSNSSFDRDFAWWIAEGVLELGAMHEALDRIYLAIRYSGIGTLDSDEGYKFEAMNNGSDFGFNTKRVDVISAGIGVRLLENLIFKAEYSHYDFDLVNGASAVLSGVEDDRDYGGIGFSLAF